MCPNFRTNRVLKYTKCHISTNLLSFLKLCLPCCQNYLPLLQQIPDWLKKIGLVRTLMPSRLFSNTNTALQITAQNEKKTDYSLESHLMSSPGDDINQVIETVLGKFKP